MQEILDNPYPPRYNITMNDYEDDNYFDDLVELEITATAIAKDVTDALINGRITVGDNVYIAYNYVDGIDNIGGHMHIGSHPDPMENNGWVLLHLAHRHPWTVSMVTEAIMGKAAGDEGYYDVEQEFLTPQEILDIYSDYDSSVLSDADTYKMDEDEIIAAAPPNAEAHIDDQSAHYWCTDLFAAKFLGSFDSEIKITKIK